MCSCGSKQPPSESKAPASPPPQKPVPADSRKVIVAFGDSLTAGFGAEPGKSYPDYLQRDLPAYRIVNLGISGDTTTDGLARVAEVVNNKPDIVIVEFGGNDGLRGLPVETTRANLDQILATFTSTGAKVVLAGMTLPPNYGAEYIKPFEQMYKDLAAKYNVPLIPFLLEGVGGHPDLMQTDGIHPKAEGNRKVAATVLKSLKPLL